MKNTNSIISLALGIAAPALAASLFATESFSPEIFLGAYAIAGMLYIVAADYSPRPAFSVKSPAPKALSTWTRLSMGRSVRSSRFAGRKTVA